MICELTKTNSMNSHYQAQPRIEKKGFSYLCFSECPHIVANSDFEGIPGNKRFLHTY